MPQTIRFVISGDAALAYWSIPEVHKPTKAQRIDNELASRALNLKPSSLNHAFLREVLRQPVLARLPQPLEILSSSRNLRRSTNQVIARCTTTPLPEGSIVRTQLPSITLGGGTEVELLACSPALLFAQMAQRMRFLDLALLGFELCGQYALAPLAPHGMTDRPPVTSAQEIRTYCHALTRAHGINAARHAARAILDNAKSPREAQLALFFTLARTEGGLVVNPPTLNAPIDLPRQIARMLGYSSISSDLGWLPQKVALEYLSREWHSTTQRNEDDSGRMNSYKMLGIDAYSVTPGQFCDFARLHQVLWSIAQSLDAHCPKQTPEEMASMRALHQDMLHGKRYPRFEDPWQATYR